MRDLTIFEYFLTIIVIIQFIYMYMLKGNLQELNRMIILGKIFRYKVLRSIERNSEIAQLLENTGTLNATKFLEAVKADPAQAFEYKEVKKLLIQHKE